MPAIPPFIEPDWPAPASVVALSTTRQGGHSGHPYASFNLGHHVGDKECAVKANQGLLQQSLQLAEPVCWMSQVHGVDVLEAGQCGAYPEADGQWSRAPGVPCAVLTADCLPVLFCSVRGDAVAAAHAGWRGLAAGVLEATVASMRVAPDELLAWLGPAIGATAFEVGQEVREAFLARAPAAQAEATDACFQPVSARPEHYMADLYSLAQLRLQAVGVTRIFGGHWCTFSDPQRFFSYRRDGSTGRMASVIALS